jgi:hypothetical protein
MTHSSTPNGPANSSEVGVVSLWIDGSVIGFVGLGGGQFLPAFYPP